MSAFRARLDDEVNYGKLALNGLERRLEKEELAESLASRAAPTGCRKGAPAAWWTKGSQKRAGSDEDSVMATPRFTPAMGTGDSFQMLAEQNVRFATDLGDRCCIIDVGEIRFQGRFEELLKNDHVVRTYLAV